MASFDFDGLIIEATRTETSNNAIEFSVTAERSPVWNFAIFCEFDESWENARLSIDPENSDVPLKAVQWAIEYSRENL